MNHVRLKESKQDAHTYLHLFENEMYPARNFLGYSANFLALPEQQEWDIQFANFIFPPDPAFFVQIDQLFLNWQNFITFGVVNLRSFSVLGIISFFVNNTFINKALSQLKSGIGLIDFYLHKLSHKGGLTTLGTVPFLSTFFPSEFSIRATDSTMLSQHHTFLKLCSTLSVLNINHNEGMN